MKTPISPRRAAKARQHSIDEIVNKMNLAVENHEKRVLHDEMRERHHIRAYIKCYVESCEPQVGVWQGGCL